MNHCEACGLPVPADGSLPDRLVAELRDGAASGRTLASRLHRRRADVMEALHELESVGVVTLERPTRSTRSEHWTLRREGTAWEPRGAAIGPSSDDNPAVTLLALLAALVATPRRWPTRLALGIAVGVGLVALGSLLRIEAAGT